MGDNSEDFNAMVARNRLQRTKSQSVPETDTTLQRQPSIDDRPRIEAYSDSDSDVESHIQRVQQIRPAGGNQQAASDAEIANQEALQSAEGSTPSTSTTSPSSAIPTTTTAAAATAGSAITHLAGSLFNKFCTPAMFARVAIMLAIQRAVPSSKTDGTNKAIDIAALVIPIGRFICTKLLAIRGSGELNGTSTRCTISTARSRTLSIVSNTGTQVVKVGEVAGLIAVSRRLYRWQQEQRALRSRSSNNRELRRSSSVSLEVLEAAASMRTIPPPKPPETAAEWAVEFSPEIREMQRIIQQCQVHLPSPRFQQPSLPAELLRYAKTCGLLTASSTSGRATSVEAAVRQVIETSDWLAQQQQKRPPIRVLKKYSRLISWKGADASGRPILLVRAGRAVQLVKSSKSNEFVQVILTYVDQGVNDLMSETPSPPPPPSNVSDTHEQQQQQQQEQEDEQEGQRSLGTSTDMDPQGISKRRRNSNVSADSAALPRTTTSASASASATTSINTTGGALMAVSNNNSNRNSVEINSITTSTLQNASLSSATTTTTKDGSGGSSTDVEGSSIETEGRPHFQQQQQQRPNEKMVVVVDCRGSSNWSAAKHLQMVKRLALDLNAHYPDRLHRLILIDIPMMGKLMIQQILPSLNALTRDKVVHRSADDPDLPVTVAILATRRSMGLVTSSSSSSSSGINGIGLRRTLSDVSFGGSSTGTASPTTTGAGMVGADELAEELERQQQQQQQQGGGGEDSFVSEEEWQTPGGAPTSVYVSAIASQEPSAHSLPMTPSFVALLSPEPSGAVQDPSSHTLLMSSMSAGTLEMVSSEDLGNHSGVSNTELQVPPGDDIDIREGGEGMAMGPPSPRVHRVASLASSLCSYGESSGCASPVLAAPLIGGGGGGGGGRGEIPTSADDHAIDGGGAVGLTPMPPLPPLPSSSSSGSPTKKGSGGPFGVGKRWQKGGTPAKSSLRRTMSEEAMAERKGTAAAAAAAAAGGGGGAAGGSGGDKGGAGVVVESYSLGRQSSVSWAQKLESVKEIDRHSQDYSRDGGK